MLQKAVNEFSIPSSKIKERPEMKWKIIKLFGHIHKMEYRLYDKMINLRSC